MTTNQNKDMPPGYYLTSRRPCVDENWPEDHRFSWALNSEDGTIGGRTFAPLQTCRADAVIAAWKHSHAALVERMECSHGQPGEGPVVLYRGQPCPQEFWAGLAHDHDDTLTLDGMPARWVNTGESIEVVAYGGTDDAPDRGPLGGAPQPRVDPETSVPWCTDACGSHRGNRCDILVSIGALGEQPGAICEPAVRAMALLVRAPGEADG